MCCEATLITQRCLKPNSSQTLLDVLRRRANASSPTRAVPEALQVLETPEPVAHHAQEQVVWETSFEDDAQEQATAHMASLIDYHKAPVAVQLGLDKAMEAEWQKYVEFNAVVPCSREEMPHVHRLTGPAKGA